MISYLIALACIACGQPDPVFEAQVVDANVSIGYGLAIGDVDGDRKPDILLADKKQFVWYRNGDWKKFILAENLTASDNVCMAARDIDGDGKVEIAVGAQWNPGETSDTVKSGAVFFLVRPADPTQVWKPVRLHHEPTVHRMRWVQTGNRQFQLIMLPLHGRGNRDGAGRGVKVIAYTPPATAGGAWTHTVIDSSMHMTHNFDVARFPDGEALYIGGKEGIKIFLFDGEAWRAEKHMIAEGNGIGEVRWGHAGKHQFIAAIEPIHGQMLTVYWPHAKSPQGYRRSVLTTALNQGHALATADLLGSDTDQVVAGWREPDAEKKTGIKLFVPQNDDGTQWKDFWIDDNGIACEDLQVADLDGDGRKDIIAAGRATHNLKIYWNKNR